VSDPTATGSTLRDDAVAIWLAGVQAVDSGALVQRAVERRGDVLLLAGDVFPVADLDRILVLGGGKAGAGMAAGLEAALGADLVDARVQGWLNVPADCVRSLRKIHLHAGRAGGQNEPTAAGVFGAEQILSQAATMGPRDLAVVLLSGGGSALLPAPVAGISLADKQVVTRLLMHRGATIEELNAVRSSLSRFKAGGLLRAMPAGRCVALIISDVIGDPLDVIASGPTVPQPSDPARALAILRRKAQRDEIPASVWTVLEAAAQHVSADTMPTVPVRNVIIGNNQTALDAAAAEAVRRGYTLAGVATNQRGIAREVGVSLAEELLRLRSEPCPTRGWCVLSGGEPTVQLVETDQPRKGGRNQELVLAALVRLQEESLERIALLSGGTDGEDGPTDAAGAVLDASVKERAFTLGLDPLAHLGINNAYPFFAAADGLLKTGPTHTNVMDVRVGLVSAE
jgi:hydroxypyruvate reductase